jgi:hypothetical protein
MSDASFPRTSRHTLKSLFEFGVIALAAAVAAACGGGGVGSEGTGITASYASGSVSGLGSIFVNGVEYDDSTARVLGDDGDIDARFTKLDTPLRVGMEVEVESGPVVCTTDASTTPPSQSCTATASQISFSTELAGPVANLATDHLSFTVLGQTVNLTSATHYEDVAGAAALAAGQIVKVHGRVDKSTGVVTATLIEKKADNLAGVPDNFMFRLRGKLTALDKANRTGTLEGETVTFATTADLTAIVVDQLVRVRIEPSAAGPWQVNRIKSAERKLDQHQGKGAELEGVITDFALSTGGTAATFKIDGMDVRVSSGSAVKFDDGASFTGLANGKLVEVEGTVDAAGVLVASKVEFKSTEGPAKIELKDTISGVVNTATVKTFAIRGYSVDFSGTGIDFRGLAAADIVTGFAGKLEIKGFMRDGVVIATRIKLEKKN